MLLDAPTGLSTEALGEEIAGAGARMEAAMAHWLGLLAEFDRREGWGGGLGFATCAQWLAWRCGLSAGTAREHVRVAAWLAAHPQVAAGLARAELSYSKVRALSRLEAVADEEAVVELARHASASQLERIVRATRSVGRAEAARAIEGRRVALHLEDDGTWVLRGRLPAEDGERLLRALERAEAEAWADGPRDGAEPEGERPSAGARRADALLALADGSAAATTTRSTDTEVVVHVDVATLATEDADVPGEAPPDRLSETAGGAPLCVETARRLCCDAGIVTSLETGDGRGGGTGRGGTSGEVLSVGRRTRSIPPALRRALRSRSDGTCAFPGCERRRRLDAHHLVHWARGGLTALKNLVELCRHHHRLVHEGGWELERLPDGRWQARAATGQLVTADPPPAVDGTRPLPPVGSGWATTTVGPDGAERADRADRPDAAPGRDDGSGLVALSAGQRWQLDLAVDAMLRWTASDD